MTSSTMDEQRPSSAGHQRPSLGPRIQVSVDDDRNQSVVDSGSATTPPHPTSANDATPHLRVPLAVRGLLGHCRCRFYNIKETLLYYTLLGMINNWSPFVCSTRKTFLCRIIYTDGKGKCCRCAFWVLDEDAGSVVLGFEEWFEKWFYNLPIPKIEFNLTYNNQFLPHRAMVLRNAVCYDSFVCTSALQGLKIDFFTTTFHLT